MAAILQSDVRQVSSINPATGEVLRSFPCASQEQVGAAVARARSSQAEWAATGVRHRLAVIKKFQSALLENKSRIAAVISGEVGKPQAEALTTEILVVLDAARFLIQNGYNLLRDEPLPHGNLATKLKRGKLIREPYGLVGIISPWNYPFSIPATEALAALVAGNAVILKPSEFTSECGFELRSLLLSAGVPENVFQVIAGDGATGAALVGSPIDKLVFTGSVATGKKIAAAAAERLLPVVLELGGKDPMLVLEDANVEVASSAAVWGAFLNAGQTCLSVERCYVHRSLYESFLAACVEKTKKLRVGSAQETEVDVGPMIHENQVRIVEAHVADAVSRGARVLVGGSRSANLGGTFFMPTVLADVTHEMQITREETFGPVLPVIVFDDEDEAVRLANDSEYGLAACIWTRDLERGEKLARRIQAGTVMVNDVVSCFGISEAPHGGVKSSGVGRAHGRFGLEEMTRLKYVDSDLMPGLKKVWWFGYDNRFTLQMNGFLDFQFARDWRRRVRGLLAAAGLAGRKPL